MIGEGNRSCIYGQGITTFHSREKKVMKFAATQMEQERMVLHSESERMDRQTDKQRDKEHVLSNMGHV